jgi:beta-phosphoglucomutase-like phosphatase (HAD superfamily)
VVDEMVRRWRSLPSPLIAGADTAVRRIAGRYPTGLASSAHSQVIAAALAATGLADAFSAVVSSDEVDRGKPAPDVYLETARRLGVEPRSCLVVEDSLNGVLAGRAAGMIVVLVPNASIPPATGAREAADLVLPDLASLDPGRLDRRAAT